MTIPIVFRLSLVIISALLLFDVVNQYDKGKNKEIHIYVMCILFITLVLLCFF